MVAALLRVPGIGKHPFWLDEANTWVIASQPFSGLVERLRQDASPPLYYAILHAWRNAFGDSELALRVPALVFGLALVLMVYRIGARHLSPQAGWWAAWLVATSPVQIFHSQQARMYTLLPLLALVGTASLVQHFETGRVRDLIRAQGATLLALLTHNMALHLLPLHVALAVVAMNRRQRVAPYFLSLAVTALLYLPWTPILLEQITAHDTYAWYAPHWDSRSGGEILERIATAAGPSGPAPPGSRGLVDLWVHIASKLAFLAVALGILRSVRRQAHWIALFLGMPIAMAFLASAWVTPHLVPGRTDQIVFPAYALLAGAALTTLPDPRAAPAPRRTVSSAIRAILLGSTLASGAWMPPLRYPTPAPTVIGTDRELARDLGAAWTPGDVVLCTSLSRATLEYYLARANIRADLQSFPRSTAEHLGGQDNRTLLSLPGKLEREAQATLEALYPRLSGSARLFVVFQNNEVNAALERALTRLESENRLEKGDAPRAYSPALLEQPLQLLEYRLPR